MRISERKRKDGLGQARTSRVQANASSTSNTVVTGAVQNGGTQHTEFSVFSALTLGVGGGDISLILAERDRHDKWWFDDTAGFGTLGEYPSVRLDLTYTVRTFEAATLTIRIDTILYTEMR